MSAAPRILVVDDEENLRHVLSLILRRGGYDVVTASNGLEALEVLDADDAPRIVLCDVRMPELDGLGLLDRLAERSERVHTVVMSAYGSMDLALEAMKRGATDYVSKPFKPDEILLTLKKVEERERLTLENERLRRALGDEGALQGLVGGSKAMLELSRTARKIALYPATVLITGESGTGKEVLARSLHRLSPRRDGPFVAINCGAIPGELLESELFGHVRGAFTGAVREREGVFEQADGGTLLLDEIGELPLELQVTLLRVLQEQVVRPVGGTRDRKVDVRVLAATARDLKEEVGAGRFRDDLFYRLDVVRVAMPALRDRREDIPMLVNHFIEQFNHRFDKRVRGVDSAALARLVDAPWPGNVRQLENTMERAVLLAEGGQITIGELPAELRGEAEPEPSPSDGEEDLSVKRRLPELERSLIARALERTGGNRTQAARLLEISYKALVYKIRDYGLGE